MRAVALIDCADCGTQISTEAFACPKCGRPTGKHSQVAKKQLKKMLVLWVVLIVAFLGIWMLLNHS